MPRALLPALLLVAACEPAPVEDRFTLALAGGEQTTKVDLNPVTVAGDVDNTTDFELLFEAPEVDDGAAEAELAEVWQYRIDYALDGEAAPPIAGVWAADEDGTGALSLAAGETLAISARAAAGEQLLWALERHAGGETTIPATLTLEGYVGNAKFALSYEYLATFAEYK